MTSPKLSQETVINIALLCRLGLSEEEVEEFRNQLSDIIQNFQILDQIDTAGVDPTAHFQPFDSVMREDIPNSSYPKEDILANAPVREGDFFRVRAVLD
ncbi:uncharacterized protein METZ01_LOCUS393474 [marine metagenome]|jgi:aspartyl-tRNA(Asn)/glutamyl-tRNA(Gln) amidotransferase subunit C|uniref:Aspartyl/glutamyl-tRNA(Asn/Gln) amidotransferase subunit C n=1 Tax=marine metagenome TaxID=408172 RepID=A0A382V2D7_9ZZZZ